MLMKINGEIINFSPGVVAQYKAAIQAKIKHPSENVIVTDQFGFQSTIYVTYKEEDTYIVQMSILGIPVTVEVIDVHLGD